MVTLILTESHYQTVLNALGVAAQECRNDAVAAGDTKIRKAFTHSAQSYEQAREVIEEFAEKQS